MTAIGTYPILRRGLSSARASKGAVGTEYHETDTGLVYEGTGTGWAVKQIASGSLGFDVATQAELDARVPAPASPADNGKWAKASGGALVYSALPDAASGTKGVVTLATAPADGSAPIAVGDNDPRNSDARAERGTLNMADYATGSGLDESTGLQAAFTAAVALNKRLVLERGKTYVHGSGLTIPNAVRVEGNGATLKKAPGFTGAGAYGLTVSGTNVDVVDLVCDGNTGAGAAGGGINWTGTGGYAGNVTSKNHATIGWLVSGASVELRGREIAAEGNGNAGFFITAGAVIKCDTRCRTKQNTNYGVWIDPTSGNGHRVDFATKNEHVGVSIRGGSGWARVLGDTNRDLGVNVYGASDWEIEEVIGENLGDPRAGSGAYRSNQATPLMILGCTNIRVGRVTAQDCTGYTVGVSSLGAGTDTGNGSQHIHIEEIVGVTAYPSDTDPILSITGGSKFITVGHIVTDGCGALLIGEQYEPGGVGTGFVPYPDRTNQHIQIGSIDAYRTRGGVIYIDGGSHVTVGPVNARDCWFEAPTAVNSASRGIVELRTADTYNVKVGLVRHASTSGAPGYLPGLVYADANATRCEVDVVGWPGSAVDANGGNQFNVRPFNPVQLFAAETTETWTASSATVTDDGAAGHFIAGNSGKKILPTGAAGSYGLGRFALGSAVDLSAMGDGDMISLYVYIPPAVFADMPASNPMQLRLNTTAVTAYFGVNIGASELVSGGQYLNVRKGRFAVQAGSPSWSSIASTDVLVQAGAGGTFNATVDDGAAHFKPPVATQSDATRSDARRWLAKKRKSGYYHTVNGPVTTGTMVNNRLYAWPLFLADAITLTKIGLEVTTIGAGTGGAGTVVVRLGIFRDDGTLYPGALLLDAGTIDATSATYQELTISPSVGPNPIWVAAAAQGCNTTNPITRAVAATLDGVAGQASSLSNANWSSYYADAQSGALPATFPSGLQTIGNAPRVLVKAA